MTERARLLLLHGLFFASGAAGLVYEVLWMRPLALLFGASAPATAATLAAFFLGLAIGSILLGERAASLRRPLRAFGLIEAGIGVAALAVVPVLALVARLIPALGRSLGDAPTGSLLVKTLLTMIALLPPTVLMGGSLPVLAEAIATNRARLGVRAGGLYAANTIGAALGALAVPAILLPALGGAGSLIAAVAVSLAVGCAALALDATLSFVPRNSASRGEAVAPHRSDASADSNRGRPEAREAVQGASLDRRRDDTRAASAGAGSLRTPLAAAFVSGLLALALETLGARMLALVHENSVYSFAAVLAVFLTGLSGGAAAARPFLRRGARPGPLVRWGWIAGGLSVALAPHLFLALTSNLRYLSGEATLLSHEARVAGLAAATLLPACLLSGLVLPAIMEQAGAGGGAASGAALGRVLFANTLGAIAGPLIVQFLAGPLLGIWNSIALTGALMALAGAGFAPSLRAAPALGAVLIAASLVFVGAPPRVHLEPGERLVELRESAFGTVAVIEEGGHRRLSLNNSYLLGGTLSTGEERLQAHIPLLLHPAPRAVAFLGLGTGITASGARFHPVERIVVYELVPEVVAAARASFRDANLGVLDDPRVRVEIDDARARLPSAPAAFDVIVGDLVVPWRRGESSLYTVESFRTARGALAPGGIYCQWVPLFQMSEREFDSIAASFLEVFPRTILFRGDFRAGESVVGLVGLASEAPVDAAAVDARVRSLTDRPDPTNPYLVDPAGLWAYLVGPLAPDDPAIRAAPRSRDDRPVVELSAPLAHLRAEGGRAGTFSGARLAPRLDELLSRPLGGTPLEQLDDRHLVWRNAGADIWRASLLSLQGRDQEADRLGLAALRQLPPAIRSALGIPAE